MTAKLIQWGSQHAFYLYGITTPADDAVRRFWNGEEFVPAARAAKFYQHQPSAHFEAQRIGHGARVVTFQVRVSP